MIRRLFKHRQPPYRPQALARRDALHHEKLAGTGSRTSRRSLLRSAGTWIIAPSCLASIGVVALDIAATAATAAQHRHFPDDTRLGRIRFGQFPHAVLGRRDVRLSAGARIYSQDNLIVPPVSVHGKSYMVGYVTGPGDEITTIWILSEDEYRLLRKRGR